MFNSVWKKRPEKHFWISGRTPLQKYYISFDKIDDSIKCLPKSNINIYDVNILNNPFSYFCWIYAISSGETNQGAICYKDQSGGPSQSSQGYKYHLFNQVGNKIKLGANIRHGDGTDAQRATSATRDAECPVNEWALTGFVYNEDGDKRIKIYVNDHICPLSTRTAGTNDLLDDSNVPLYIGNRWRGDNTHEGFIREVMIFKGTALNSFQVTRLYDGIIPKSITAYYDFHEGNGNDLHEIIGNADGIIGSSSNPGGIATFVPGNPAWGIY